MFKEILKASRNNQASIFAFTFKFKHKTKSIQNAGRGTVVIYFTDPMRCLRLCRHLLTSSLLLFSRSLLMRMWYFSSKQSLHLSEDPLYGVALSMMPQDKSYSSFFSFKCQMCLLSSVAFLRLLFLNDCLWPYNHFLNVPSVSPTY